MGGGGCEGDGAGREGPCSARVAAALFMFFFRPLFLHLSRVFTLLGRLNWQGPVDHGRQAGGGIHHSSVYLSNSSTGKARSQANQPTRFDSKWLGQSEGSRSKAPPSAGHEDVFVEESTGYPITDDHIPLLQAGLRVIDVIDLDYPYHHRPSDTLDKISARSLSIVGEVAEALVR